MLLLFSLLVVAVFGGTLTGRIVDSVTQLPVPYARLTYTSSGFSQFGFSLVNGTYTITYTGSVPVISLVEHGAYENLMFPNSTDTIALTSLPSSTIFPFGSDGSFELLRAQLLWRQGGIDMDLIIVTLCGQVTFQTRLLAIGGVSVRIDNDFVNTFGVENPTVSTLDYPSLPPNGDFRFWHVTTLQVRLVNPTTKQRTYTFAPQNLYTNTAPLTFSNSAPCGLDNQWCRTIQGSASIASASLMLLVLIFVTLF